MGGWISYRRNFVGNWVEILAGNSRWKGYVLGGVGDKQPIKLENRTLLAEIISEAHQAGAIMGTVAWVQDGVDLQAEYITSIPSQQKPVIAISGCRKPRSLLGLVSFVQIDIDLDWVERVRGEAEAKRLLNNLLMQCLIQGMSREDIAVFRQALDVAFARMGDVRVFEVNGEGRP